MIHHEVTDEVEDSFISVEGKLKSNGDLLTLKYFRPKQSKEMKLSRFLFWQYFKQVTVFDVRGSILDAVTFIQSTDLSVYQDVQIVQYWRSCYTDNLNNLQHLIVWRNGLWR